MSGEMWRVNSEETLQHFVAIATGRWKQGITYKIIHPSRSAKQNAALHACFRRLSANLNDAGFGVPHPLKPELEIPWTETSVKELLLRPIIRAMYDKEATSQLTTDELSKAIGVMLNRVAELTGVVEEFVLGELSHG